MGKSPGKWIKTVLFGKKPTKHQLSKKREKFPNEREVVVAAKASGADYVSVPPATSHLYPTSVEGNEGILEVESKQVGDLHVNDEIHLEGNHNAEAQGSLPQDAPVDPEQIKKERAATALQATFRGYLARRAFWALKGIIRLQALIRGHLVRRQAVATLCSLLGIVKFQAIIRGKRVRDSDIGIEVQSKCSLVLSQEGKNTDPVDISTQISKLSTNAFIRKLLAPSPNATPLYVHYESGEPNSVASWLERWSSTRFWKPVALLKKNPEVKSQKKHASNGHAAESHANRSKRTRRPTSNHSETVPTSEFEKPKRTFRKVSSHPAAEAVPENPQVDLEKVKRNLRKVHNPVVENSVPSEAEIDPKRSLEKEKNTGSAPDGSDQFVGNVAEKAKKETTVSEKVKKEVTTPSEKVKKESTASEMSKREAPSNEKAKKDGTTPSEKVKKESSVSEMAKRETMSNEKVKKEPAPLLSEAEPIPEPITTTKEIADLSLSDQPVVDEPPTEIPSNGDILPGDQVTVESLVLTGKEDNVSETKEDLAATENGKSGRKAFTPAKQERPENGQQNSPALPSYMAATESAKAKLRAQGGSPKPAPEVIDKNNLNRRHSLPSSTNSKVSSQSPRTQRPTAQSGGKSGNKVDRGLTSRDGNGKAAQAEWRR